MTIMFDQRIPDLTKIMILKLEKKYQVEIENQVDND